MPLDAVDMMLLITYAAHDTTRAAHSARLRAQRVDRRDAAIRSRARRVDVKESYSA